MTRLFPFNNWISTSDHHEIEFSSDPAISLSDTVFGFLDEGSSSPDSDGVYDFTEEGDDEEVKENDVNNQDISFWETQHQLLEGRLKRRSSIESRIRRATKEGLIEAEEKQVGNVCSCREQVGNACRKCLMKIVLTRLQNAGFNCSKWPTSPQIPSGEHSFLEVLESSNSRKGDVRIIIELNLRGEFEIARAGEEYNGLVNKLPEVFIGKIERLLSIIKILCCAAKKCMKDKKMHMGPWRKQRYMQAKWLRATHPMTSSPNFSTRPLRHRASMLTADLLENFPNLHSTAVQVV